MYGTKRNGQLHLQDEKHFLKYRNTCFVELRECNRNCRLHESERLRSQRQNLLLKISMAYGRHTCAYFACAVRRFNYIRSCQQFGLLHLQSLCDNKSTVRNRHDLHHKRTEFDNKSFRFSINNFTDRFHFTLLFTANN